MKHTTAFVCMFLFGFGFSTSQAQTVTSTADAGPGSLRAAVAAATSGATILFDAALTGQMITLTSGEIAIGTDLTIEGADRRITISGGNTVRLFSVTSGVGVGMLNLTLVDGLAPGAVGRGGAIANGGTLTLVRCTISGHSAYNAGAIDNQPGATFVGEACTFTNNSTNGNSSGAFANGDGATATFTNCTFWDNSATGTNRVGGAIGQFAESSSLPQMILVNCTVANNSATGSGGGIFNSGAGTVALRNTIVADNIAPAGADLSGTFVSLGNNLFTGTAGATIGGPGTGSDLVMAASLGDFGSFGGPTQTVALLGESPAVHSGSTVGDPSHDQRGIPRDGAPDIGAFELTSIYQSLPFSQNWTDTSLLTSADNWTGVPGILGFRGDLEGSMINVDPQTLLGTFGPLDALVNQTSPLIATGGVAEFHITDPVVALNGSGTADAPSIVLHLNATGCSGLTISYRLRDIDSSPDNSVQQVALHYRTTVGGPWTNVPAGYVEDASAGPSMTMELVAVVPLPAAVDNAATLQIRIMTTNATGTDEWIGVDDILVQGTCIPTDVTAGPPIPELHALSGIIPNPFNATTTIQFDLARPEHVRLTIYGIDGRRLITLIDGAEFPAGRHRTTWNGIDAEGRSVASGVYVCRLELEGFEASRRLVVVK